MDARMQAVAAIALMATTVLAGCMGEPQLEFTVPGDAGPDARQDGVATPHVLEVRVASETPDGSPLAGAAVVFFRFERGGTTFDTDVDVDPPYSRTRVDVSLAGPDTEVLATGRTGADGVVRGHLAPSTTVWVAVGDVDGYTSELRDRVAVGAGGDRSRVAVPLFLEERAIRVEDAMPTSASAEKATLGVAPPERHPVPASFHADADVDEAYLQRLAFAEVTLSWENTATAYGDLYAGLSAGDDEPFVVGADRHQAPVPGAYEESVATDDGDLEEVRARLVRRGLALNAMTGSAAASLDGLPVTFTGNATFEGANVRITG